MKYRKLFNILFISVVLALFSFVLSSCEFIYDIFGINKGDGNNVKKYTLNINFNYYGSDAVQYDSPLVIWVMPLDSNGDVIIGDDGKPQREILTSDKPDGLLSIDLEEGSYTILAFIDKNNNLWPDGSPPSSGTTTGEHYIIYDNYDLWSGGYTAIDVNSNQDVTLDFGDDYDWHYVRIISPGDGESISNTWLDAYGDLIFMNNYTDIKYNLYSEDQVVYVYEADQYVDSLDFEKGEWGTGIDLNGLYAGNYTLKVYAVDSNGNYIDVVSVTFYYEGFGQA